MLPQWSALHMFLKNSPKNLWAVKNGERCTLKKKAKLSSSMWKFGWDRVQSHEEGLPNIRGNAQVLNHIRGGHLSYMTLQRIPLNYPTFEEIFSFFFISVGWALNYPLVFDVDIFFSF
jgi:hypothetical protein